MDAETDDDPDAGSDDISSGFSANKLRDLVKRVEALHADRQAIADDIAVVMGEVKAAGFDVPTVKIVLARRRKSPAEQAEVDHRVTLYEQALDKSEATRRPH